MRRLIPYRIRCYLYKVCFNRYRKAPFDSKEATFYWNICNWIDGTASENLLVQALDHRGEIVIRKLQSGRYVLEWTRGDGDHFYFENDDLVKCFEELSERVAVGP